MRIGSSIYVGGPSSLAPDCGGPDIRVEEHETVFENRVMRASKDFPSGVRAGMLYRRKYLRGYTVNSETGERDGFCLISRQPIDSMSEYFYTFRAEFDDGTSRGFYACNSFSALSHVRGWKRRPVKVVGHDGCEYGCPKTFILVPD